MAYAPLLIIAAARSGVGTGISRSSRCEDTRTPVPYSSYFRKGTFVTRKSTPLDKARIAMGNAAKAGTQNQLGLAQMYAAIASAEALERIADVLERLAAQEPEKTGPTETTIPIVIGQ
jgi:hypothetical protein